MFGPLGTPAAELAAFLLGAYFLASSLFDSATLYVLATASRHFKTDTDAFLRVSKGRSQMPVDHLLDLLPFFSCCLFISPVMPMYRPSRT